MTDGWEGILDPGERIVWQGRPDGAIVFKPANVALFLFGLAFAGFALFWMIMAASAGGAFWMFGLLHFAVGLGMAFGAIGWDAYKRRHSWYTLTDRRAFIATNLPLSGKRLASYPIDAGTRLSLTGTHPASLHFATRRKRGKNGSYDVPVGFERLEDAQRVYRLMRGVQTGATRPGDSDHARR